MLLSPSLLFRAPACFPTLGPLSGLCNHLASHPETFASLSPLDDWSARTKVPELEMLFGRKICGAGHAAHVQKTLTDNTGVDVRPYTEIITEFYQKRPSERSAPYVLLLELLSDGQAKSAEELYRAQLGQWPNARN